MNKGRIIKHARRKKGWSRQILSAKTNYFVSEATVKRVETISSYNISAEKLIALCKALDIDLNSFQDKKKQ